MKITTKMAFQGQSCHGNLPYYLLKSWKSQYFTHILRIPMGIMCRSKREKTLQKITSKKAFSGYSQCPW